MQLYAILVIGNEIYKCRSATAYVSQPGPLRHSTTQYWQSEPLPRGCRAAAAIGEPQAAKQVKDPQGQLELRLASEFQVQVYLQAWVDPNHFKFQVSTCCHKFQR